MFRILFIYIDIDSGLRMLLLLSCVIIAGIAANGPPKTHYKMKNSSLCLQVGKSPPYKDVRWRFNNDLIVFEKAVTANFIDKVDHNPNNHSLCIKKLTEKDSGDYIAVIVDSNTEESTETNKLIVEETVPKPDIRMSVIGSNGSAGFCNISINCSVLDEWLWAVCDEDSCRPSERSFSKFNITIFPHNRAVVCSGHNYVSRSNVSESLPTACYSKRMNEHVEKSSPPRLIVIGIAVAIGVTLCAFIGFLIKILCLTENSGHQTSTAQLIQNQPIPVTQSQPVSRESTSSSNQPDACYENVDAAQPSQINHPNSHPKKELGSKESQAVDTVYSVLQLPHVTNSLGNSDRENQTKVEDTTSASSVTLGEAAQPMQIDTVYSVLQKQPID